MACALSVSKGHMHQAQRTKVQAKQHRCITNYYIAFAHAKCKNLL